MQDFREKNPHMTEEQIIAFGRMAITREMLERKRQFAMNRAWCENTPFDEDACARLEATWLPWLLRLPKSPHLLPGDVRALKHDDELVTSMKLDHNWVTALAQRLRAEFENDAFSAKVQRRIKNAREKDKPVDETAIRERVAMRILEQVLDGEDRGHCNGGARFTMTAQDREFADTIASVMHERLTRPLDFCTAVLTAKSMNPPGIAHEKFLRSTVVATLETIFLEMRRGECVKPLRQKPDEVVYIPV